MRRVWKTVNTLNKVARNRGRILVLVALAIGIGASAPRDSAAFMIEISSDQFSGQTNVYSSVTHFSISIEVLGPLASGAFCWRGTCLTWYSPLWAVG